MLLYRHSYKFFAEFILALKNASAARITVIAQVQAQEYLVRAITYRIKVGCGIVIRITERKERVDRKTHHPGNGIILPV